MVFYIADSVEKIAAENQAEHVSRVVLRIGEVSSIVNDYLEDCWKWNAKRRPMLDGCELKIETVPALTYCEDCGGKYETVVHGKICPFCRRRRLRKLWWTIYDCSQGGFVRCDIEPGRAALAQ